MLGSEYRCQALTASREQHAGSEQHGGERCGQRAALTVTVWIGVQLAAWVGSGYGCGSIGDGDLFYWHASVAVACHGGRYCGVNSGKLGRVDGWLCLLFALMFVWVLSSSALAMATSNYYRSARRGDSDVDGWLCLALWLSVVSVLETVVLGVAHVGNFLLFVRFSLLFAGSIVIW